MCVPECCDLNINYWRWAWQNCETSLISVCYTTTFMSNLKSLADRQTNGQTNTQIGAIDPDPEQEEAYFARSATPPFARYIRTELVYPLV